MGNTKGVKAGLMQYFEAHPGVNVYLEQLQKALGEDRAAVQAGIRNLRHDPAWDAAIEVVVRGQAWKYIPPGDAAQQGDGTGRCFEQIGTTREGDLILQSDDGGIFRATEL